MVIPVATGKRVLGMLMCYARSGSHFTAAFDAVFKGQGAEPTASRLLVLITVYNSFHFDIIVAYLGTTLPKDTLNTEL